MLNVAMISTWHVHTKGYTKELLASGKVCIKAVWDDDKARGKAYAEEHGAEFTEDYDALLARGDIQAVICNSPTTMHPELLSKAAAAGKHIFTEKLLAVTSEDCAKLAKQIVDSGVTFTVSLPLRANPQMLYAKELIDSGALGKVTGARMRRSHSGVSDRWLPEYWFDVSKTGGGAMMDLGAHPVYMLSFLLGAPKRVSGMTANLFGTSSDENAIGLVEFENGALGTCETAFVTFGVPDLLEVYGTEGSVFIHGDRVKVATKALTALGVREVKPRQLPEAKPSPLMQFVDACLNGTGTPEHLGTEDAMVMTRMIEAVYASDREGRTITL